MTKSISFKNNSIFVFASVLLTANSLFAQAPGGVAASGSNELWLDASTLSLSNNAVVSSWTDVSGNNNHATSINSARPLYKTNQINGKPAIKFDGINDRLRTGSIAALNTNLQTSFSVFSSASVNTGVVYRSAYTSGAGSSSNFIYGVYYSPSTTQLAYSTRNSNGTAVTQFRNPYAGAVALTSLVWNGSSSLLSKYDGSIVSSGVGGNAIPSGNLGVTIAANWQGNMYLDLLMAEHITYSSALSSAEIKIVENYLAAKYNLTINNDMYAHQATYGNDVIGLGQESDGNNLSAQGTSNLAISIASLNDGEYIFAGHDNTGYSANIADVPTNYSRYNQVWRADVTGVPGTITVAFDVSTYSLGGQNNYVLFVDADGVFATGSTEYVGVYNSGTVTFSNVVMTDGAYFTLANSPSTILSSGVTNDWHLTTTWDCSCIPSLGNDVTIQNGHSVFINGQKANAATLTIDGTLTFSGSDTLEVPGDFTNNNTFVSGTGTLLLSGLTAQNLTGTTQFYHLAINNTSGVTNLGSISVQGWLNVIAGTLNTGNNVTLLSNASGSAGVKNPATGTILGDVTVQRYLNEGESWYLLAPAVTDGNLEDWNQEFEMQGFTGTDWLGGAPSVYFYNQNNNVSDFNDGYTVPTNTANTIDIKRGWETYVGNDSYATGARTIDMTGTLGLGYYSFSCLHVAKIGDPSQDGWSLITNPFAAPVSWSKVKKTGLFDEAQYKQTDGSSAVIDNSFVLAPGEAFWVHYNPGSGGQVQFEVGDVSTTLVDNYNNRMANSQEQELLSISLRDVQQNYIDYCYLGFSDNATNDKDAEIDAYKLPQSNLNLPNISTVMSGKKLLKNVMNSNSNEIIAISIYTRNPTGILRNYTLNFSNVTRLLNNNKTLVLEDKELNTFTKLTSDMEYDFIMNDANVDSRFFIHITTPLTFVSNNVSCNGKKDGSASVSLNSNIPSSFIWKDLNGNVLLSTKNSISSTISGLEPNDYILEVNDVKNYFSITQPEIVEASFTASFGGLDYGRETSNLSNDTLFIGLGEEVTFTSYSINQEYNNWDFGDLTNSSEDSPKHLYFNTGIYEVKLTSAKGSCFSTVNKFIQVDGKTGIDQTNLFDEVNVTVKENNLNVFMNNNYNGVVSFEVLNSIGQTVYSSSKQIASDHIEEIKLNVASGVYMLKIDGLNNSKIKKIVLN